MYITNSRMLRHYPDNIKTLSCDRDSYDIQPLLSNSPIMLLYIRLPKNSIHIPIGSALLAKTLPSSFSLIFPALSVLAAEPTSRHIYNPNNKSTRPQQRFWGNTRRHRWIKRRKQNERLLPMRHHKIPHPAAEATRDIYMPLR